MATVEDSELVRLATGRERELFPVLGRVGSLTPLIALLAVLPGIYALLVHQTLDDLGARWGLKALALLGDDSFSKALDPPGPDPLRWQNPLGTWLTALTMRILGAQHKLSLVLVEYLSHVAMVCAGFLLVRRLFGPRCAFWATLILACHGPLLQDVVQPLPTSLGIFWSLSALGLFLSHLEHANSVVSWSLLFAGISLGLCLLSGGPLALGVAAILLLHVLALRGEHIATRRGETIVRRKVWVGWPALKSLGVLCLTGFAVGGWWVLMMSSQYGSDFRASWFAGAAFDRPLPAAATALADGGWLIDTVSPLLEQLGLLTGLAVLGAWHVVRALADPSDESGPPHAQFLVAWLGVALLIWQSTVGEGTATSTTAAMWESFLLIACIVVAALGIDDIVQRRVPLWLAAFVVVASLCVPLIRNADSGGWGPLPRALVVIVGAGAAGWALARFGEGRESRRRPVLSLLVFAPLLLNAWLGLTAAESADEDTRTLQALARRLADMGPVHTGVIVSSEQPPPELRFWLRSLWTDAEILEFDQWERALNLEFAASPEGSQPVVVVDWGSRENRVTGLQFGAAQVEQIVQPRYFRSRQLRVYLLRPR